VNEKNVVSVDRELAGGRAVDPLERLILVSTPVRNKLVVFLPNVNRVELGIRATARRKPCFSMLYKIPPPKWGEKRMLGWSFSSVKIQGFSGKHQDYQPVYQIPQGRVLYHGEAVGIQGCDSKGVLNRAFG